MNCRKILLYIQYILDYIIYFFSHLIPRNNNRWLFGSGFGFRDNAKYFYLEISNNKKIETYWISKSEIETQLLNKRGVRAVYQKSLYGLYLCLTSKVYIFTHNSGDISYFMSGNAIKVNLWHGLLFKAVNLGVNSEYASNPMLQSNFFNPMKYERLDVFLQPSPFTYNDFCRMFYIREDGNVQDSYPRCDIFNKSPQTLEGMMNKDGGEIVEMYRLLQGKTCSYIYMPTFRDMAADFFEASGINIQLVNNIMKEQNSLLLIKFHHNDLKKLNDYPSLSNVYFVQTNVDVYPILSFIDVLITDYSSIYYDFLLLKKPIILFPFDLTYYTSSCRNILYDYDETFVGTRCDNSEELMNSLQNRTCFSTKMDYDALISKYWYPHTGKLSKLIMNKTGIGYN